MKPSTSSINILLFCAMLTISIILVSCATNADEHWKFIGRQMIGVDSIAVPGTIWTDDTLAVRIWSKDINGDMFLDEAVEVERDSFHVTQSLWADIYEWIGSGYMPPTDTKPMWGDSCLIDPPFYPGDLTVSMLQPDTSALEQTIVVVNRANYSTRVSDLIDRTWGLESFGKIGEEDSLLSGTEIYIEFYEEFDHGKNTWTFAGCNECGGDYEASDDGSITIRQGGCTEKACLPLEIMNQEERYIMNLNAVSQFRIKEQHLQLLYNNRESVLNYILAVMILESPE